MTIRKAYTLHLIAAQLGRYTPLTKLQFIATWKTL
jgi:hypothetical protein